MKLQCSHCNRTMTSDQELAVGTRVECPACKNPFNVDTRTVVNTVPVVKTESTPNGVKIVGVDIPLWDMIKLLVEIAVAAIPALLILWAVAVLVGAIFVMFAKVAGF